MGLGAGRPHAHRRPDTDRHASPPAAARNTRGPRRYRPVTRDPGRGAGPTATRDTTATARRRPHTRVPETGRRPSPRSRPDAALSAPEPQTPGPRGPSPARARVPGAPLVATEGVRGASTGSGWRARAGGATGREGAKERERARESRTDDGGRRGPGARDTGKRGARRGGVGHGAEDPRPTGGEPAQGRRREGDGRAGGRAAPQGEPPPPRHRRATQPRDAPEAPRGVWGGRERGWA